MSTSVYVIMAWSVSIIAVLFTAYRVGVSRGKNKKIKEAMKRADRDAQIVLENQKAGPRSGDDLLDGLRKWERTGDPR